MVADEQQPLLQGESRQPQQIESPAAPDAPAAPAPGSSRTNGTAGKDAGIDKLIFVVMILGVFLSLACESMVASTQEGIASDFNDLSLAPWLLMAYSMGYSMMLPLVSVRTSYHGSG